MAVAPQWFALAAAMTLVNGATIGFVALREKHRGLRFWAAAWLAWAVAVWPMSALGSQPSAPVPAVALGLLWVVSTLCFLAGAYELAERRMPPAWLAVALACVAVGLALGVGPRGEVGMLPLVVFQCVGLVATGVLIIRSARSRVGAWLAGLALIGLAVHLLDAPVLAAHVDLMLWGFVLATALEVLAALGMIALYYEHAREQLVAAQRALAETRRIEALGRVAGGVAHDFNNMLTVMQAHLDLLLRGRDSEDDVRQSIAAMQGAVEQAGRLTAQLLSFGRRSTVAPTRVDVREVVSGTVGLLARVTPAEIGLEFKCAEATCPATLDRTLLEQVVLNLVTNARDAIEGVGRIKVTLGRRDDPSPQLVLSVEDDGRGMDAELLGHVFEPFFTTKPAGKGTGLGLASVHGAVSQLGGSVSVQSWPGKGSRFDVVLPLADSPRAPPAPNDLESA